ncbi:hypothetical protein F511_06965 [Dorcoceras hygrometricum]|uniref:Uncharacterized protein n=2 Tax=Dorcoceras hygrometricum TaxID=472368 RepID=A0A2Z7B9R6_9LAMI|nr:hypothetical protein F511_06965 [Dorcoceras hygrometricum]
MRSEAALLCTPAASLIPSCDQSRAHQQRRLATFVKRSGRSSSRDQRPETHATSCATKQHQPSAYCATSAHKDIHRPLNKRAAARAHARGEGAPPCKAAPMPEPKLVVSILKNEGIQLAVGPQPLWLRNHNSGLAHRIMVKRLATSPHDPLGITDSACKNQLVVVSVQYGPFNPYIPIRSTTIGKSRVAKDPIAMHTSWRSNSDIASVTRLESPNEGSSIDHQVNTGYRTVEGRPGMIECYTRKTEFFAIERISVNNISFYAKVLKFTR